MKYIKILTVISVPLLLLSCDVSDISAVHSPSPSSNKPAYDTDKCEPQGSVLVADRLRVIDGDTVEVIPANGQPERIRLVGIDAPEYNQPFGDSSTQAFVVIV